MNRTDLEAEIRRLHGESWGWALACCHGNRSDAEDVLQNAYVRVLSGRAHFDRRSAFRTWLFGVIRHTAAEYRRSRTRYDAALNRSAREATPGTDSAGALTAHDRIERDEMVERLNQALEQLTPMQRNVLHLVFYQGMTIADAAAALGVRLGTARTHYARGKKRLGLLLRGAVTR